ncbi:MAG TPA: restriction endonuclease subunit S [Elusimicrobiota bacterium]|nr:restriction endonuclease subunit S [Elusimicrobiota bacterium]
MPQAPVSFPETKTRWKSYPAYKDSGVEWLGEIPARWLLLRLRYCARINPTKSEISRLPDNTVASFVPMEALGEYGGVHLEETKTLCEVSGGYTYFREGDVLLAKITPCFENGKGSIAEGLENGLGFGTTELHVLRPGPTIDRRFLFYLTTSHPFRHIGTGYMYGAGGQKRVPDDFVRNFRHPISSIEEQRAIAAFLDRETARIDALIEKKRRQIELLHEKRAAVISHAVTKGLDPKAKMKDSGVEWLGEIPEHWEIIPLFTIARERDTRNTGLQEMNILSLSYGKIVRRDISDNFGLIPESFETYQIVIPGNVVLRLTDLQNDKRSLRVGLVGERGIITSAYIVLDIIEGVSAKFLHYLIHSYDVAKVFYNLGAGVRQTMKFEDLKRMPIALPKLKEQRAIAAFLDRETARIDALIDKIEQSMNLLREERAALISAAVTGKIDVREE